MDNANRKPRVAFVTSHPIQYQVPVFRFLAERSDLEFETIFAMLPDAAKQGDGFGVEFEWDIPLLEGFQYHVLQNRSKMPSVTSFKGCDTPDIGRIFRERKYDIVFVNGWVVKTCLQALWACKMLGLPIGVRCEANHLRPRAWWKRALQRQLVRRFDAFLPIGNANREFYASYGISAERMFSSPYCVDNNRFAKAATKAQEQRDSIRDHWRIPRDSCCFLYCGKFESKKHPLQLIESFLNSNFRQSNSRLLMVGDGELRHSCEALVRAKLGNTFVASESPVVFAGFLNQSQIVDAYIASDMLLMPSNHGETWGLVVNEAFSCGRPAIVSSLVGCSKDLILEGHTGHIFPYGDWDRLTELISNCSLSLAKLEKMGNNAREHIVSYGPIKAADGIANATHWLMNR